MVKKVTSQMRARFLDLIDPFSISGFLASIKLACGTNCMHGKAAMFVQPHYVNETLGNVLNSRMCATDKSFLFAASVRNVDKRSPKLLRSHP